MKGPLVSIVIPTYNRKDKLIRLIRSIHKSTYNNLEIMVVDDASTDGTYELLTKIYPTVKVIRNEKEHMSSESRNIGTQCSKGEFIFIIDDDNIIHKNAIKYLVNVMNGDKTIGIAAPIMYYYDRPDIIWYAGGKLNSLLIPYHVNSNKKIEQLNLPLICDTDYVPNAYMIRKETAKKVSHDSKNFPHNWDEQDFCLRVKNQGYQLITVTSSKIWHDVQHGRKITRISMSKIKDQARSRIIFVKKHGSIFQKLFFYSLIFPTSLVYYFFTVLFSKDNDIVRVSKIKLLKNYLGVCKITHP